MFGNGCVDLLHFFFFFGRDAGGMGTCGQFEPDRSHPLSSHLLLALLVTIHHSSFIIHDLTFSVERSGWKSGSKNESESETNRQGYTFGTADAISTGFTFSCSATRIGWRAGIWMIP